MPPHPAGHSAQLRHLGLHFHRRYVKFCGYFPFTGQIYLNGHEYAMRQCLNAGIAFTALDNAFGSASDPVAVQRICDGLTDQKIYRFAGKWLARLPHPFTREDEEADYCWQLSVQQVGFSTTMALDRPMCGRIFFEQLIRDNIDIGRPDKVNIVFDRKIRLGGKNPTPGTFRTQMITSGACPYLYLFYKKTQVKQYLKEGRALRTETRLNQPRDFGIGKELTNLAAMAEVGYAANRRLLDAECISHDPADGAAALEAITSPVISTTCTRVPGMRFPDPRVQALLGACCALALRPAGFTSRDLRHYLASQLGKTPEDMTGGQISYDLRRLRAHQLIERIPHSRAYQVTEDGLSIALRAAASSTMRIRSQPRPEASRMKASPVPASAVGMYVGLTRATGGPCWRRRSRTMPPPSPDTSPITTYPNRSS
jgi:hypothetical protein